MAFFVQQEVASNSAMQKDYRLPWDDESLQWKNFCAKKSMLICAMARNQEMGGTALTFAFGAAVIVLQKDWFNSDGKKMGGSADRPYPETDHFETAHPDVITPFHKIPLPFLPRLFSSLFPVYSAIFFFPFQLSFISSASEISIPRFFLPSHFQTINLEPFFFLSNLSPFPIHEISRLLALDPSSTVSSSSGFEIGAMIKVYENWERLVRATLQREQLRTAGQGPGRTSSGIAGAVPPSLGRTTNIDAILQAADEIQAEDPNVARILCEQAYSLAQDLDPNSEGRGMLQFKTGLMSVIKQKLAKKDGTRIDRKQDLQRLWEFYQRYKVQHRVDDIQREEETLRQSGTFGASMEYVLLFGHSSRLVFIPMLGYASSRLELRAMEMKKVFATLKAIVEVIELLAGDAPTDGVARQIKDELRKIKQSDAVLTGELVPYNIVPLDGPALTNVIGLFPEQVKAAISAISHMIDFARLPSDFKVPDVRNLDMFDLLEFVFGFQGKLADQMSYHLLACFIMKKGNIRNQRENVILLIANAQSCLGIPGETDPKADMYYTPVKSASRSQEVTQEHGRKVEKYVESKKEKNGGINKIDERAITEVFLKVLDNYIKWCKYLRIRLAWNSTAAINQDRKLIMISLYFLIWGEAANMAKELDAILDQPEAMPALSSYLEQIISPIYKTMAEHVATFVALQCCHGSTVVEEAARNNNGKAAHSAWRNYDDFNEYFWYTFLFITNSAVSSVAGKIKTLLTDL
ncbi:hypothetical protein ACLOJK_033976 [Asimina triloba]